MGNNWIWPVVIIGGVVLVGGYFLLQGVGGFLADPKGRQFIHTITSDKFKQIASDLETGKITQAEGEAQVKALSQSRVNYARFSI